MVPLQFSQNTILKGVFVFGSVLSVLHKGFSLERNCVLRRWESETLK